MRRMQHDPVEFQAMKINQNAARSLRLLRNGRQHEVLEQSLCRRSNILAESTEQAKPKELHYMGRIPPHSNIISP